MSNPLAELGHIALSDNAADNGSLGPEIFVATVAGMVARAEIKKVDEDLAALAVGMRSGHVQVIAVTL